MVSSYLLLNLSWFPCGGRRTTWRRWYQLGFNRDVDARLASLLRAATLHRPICSCAVFGATCRLLSMSRSAQPIFIASTAKRPKFPKCVERRNGNLSGIVHSSLVWANFYLLVI